MNDRAELFARFEQWWQEHGRQYELDAYHMSEFHMAFVAWAGGVEDERKQAERRDDNRAPQ